MFRIFSLSVILVIIICVLWLIHYYSKLLIKKILTKKYLVLNLISNIYKIEFYLLINSVTKNKTYELKIFKYDIYKWVYIDKITSENFNLLEKYLEYIIRILRENFNFTEEETLTLYKDIKEKINDYN